MIDPKFFIGQDKVLRQINFYIEGHKKNGFMPALLLASARGSGKTKIAHQIGKQLLDSNGEPKTLLEVNGANLQKIGQFFNTVIVPYVGNGEYVTLFIDEISNASKEVLNWLLRPLSIPDGNNYQTHGEFLDQTIVFDWKKFSFIAATTNPEKLGLPLNQRLERLTFTPYSETSLIKILWLHSGKSIKYKENIEYFIIKTCRESPREVVRLCRKIKQYLAQKESDIFGKNEWEELKAILDLKPLGLTNAEISVLKLLNERGAMTLTHLAACLAIDITSLRRDIELYLLNQNLLRIDGTRCLTERGQKILQECNI